MPYVTEQAYIFKMIKDTKKCCEAKLNDFRNSIFILIRDSSDIIHIDTKILI